MLWKPLPGGGKPHPPHPRLPVERYLSGKTKEVTGKGEGNGGWGEGVCSRKRMTYVPDASGKGGELGGRGEERKRRGGPSPKRVSKTVDRPVVVEKEWGGVRGRGGGWNCHESNKRSSRIPTGSWG